MTIHSMAGRATPSMISNYKLALMLHKIYNCINQSDEWIHLNINQAFTSRQTCFHFNRHNNLTVGMNALSNRLFYINDKIPFELLNTQFESFKIECTSLGYDFVGNETKGSVSGINMTLVIF
jgi:hypothetical protein